MLNPDLLARFTTHLKEALQKSLLFAVRNGRALLEPGDLLVGLLQEQGSIGAEILHKLGVKLPAAEDYFAGRAKAAAPNTALAPDLSPGTKRVLEKCVLLAHLSEHKYVGTEHLLFSLLDLALPEVHGFFVEQGVNIVQAKDQVSQILKSTARFPDLTPEASEEASSPSEEGGGSESDRQPAAEPRGRTSRDQRVKALQVFARELTSSQTIEKLDPVIGREAEMDRVIEILCRRTKNNPLLLGEPGVGKTAIVEGLAQRIVSGDIPDILQGKRLYALDLALMVAGTMYRGEFEARLKQLVEEVKADQNILLFIDEIHTLVGAGSTSGSMDAANILKPALARGEIHCIGATTWNEYKKHIEPDAALERRYQTVQVQEPSQDTTILMLRGLKERYEDHHSVVFSEAALESAVRLAGRYLTDRFFPDKAIDLLDEAAAHANAHRRSNEGVERLRALDIAINVSREQKEEAVEKGLLAEASKALAQEERLKEERTSIQDTLEKGRKADRLVVGPQEIAKVVARMANIPLSLVLASERDQLIELETRLGNTIVGQQDAVRLVSDALRRARLGLSDPRRPKASFLFVGPSGVGKTELARSLAKEIFGREDALVKLDMSEFAEGHSVSKLLGSPAGYVGYREGNRLADTIRKNPHAVFLFDEFEKAHPDVQHILLQALEDGQMNDSTGRPISFRHAYIVLTSNAGADLINRGSLGFGEAAVSGHAYDEMVKSHLKERFRLELLNRLDKIIVFRALEKDSLKEIVRREVEEVVRRLEKVQAGTYTVGDDVLEWLLAQQRHGDEGARVARRLVEQEVTSLLSKALLNQPKKKIWNIKVTKNKLAVK